VKHVFADIATATARQAGRPITFLFAVFIIIAWAVTGPIFHYSDTWQLIINTGTTIITFLMVFIIQNTQNRDGAASSDGRRDFRDSREMPRPRKKSRRWSARKREQESASSY
jgi:hypothetical protein